MITDFVGAVVVVDADPADVGGAVAAEAGDAVTDGVSNYDGDFLDETAVPEVSEPLIAGVCTLTAATQICEVDQQGIKVFFKYQRLYSLLFFIRFLRVLFQLELCHTWVTIPIVMEP